MITLRAMRNFQPWASSWPGRYAIRVVIVIVSPTFSKISPTFSTFSENILRKF